MIIVWFIVIPGIGAILAYRLARFGARLSRWVSLLALAANLGLAIWMWATNFGPMGYGGQGPWLAEINRPWIPQLGIGFHLAMDGLSLLLVALTAFVGMAAVIASWNEIQERVAFFHFNLMWVLGGITGVFLALDLFLFYFFWEMMLVPAYFLFLWGHERRTHAAVKFFIFTQLSGLLMLLAILGLVFVHARASGTITFDYSQLLGTPVGSPIAFWLMLGFFIAFAVKLPVVGVHTWLPDAYTQAPTAGTVILASLMAKTGGYGLLRFVVPLFPGPALSFSAIALPLAVAGILYGAILAYPQRDLKRLVAYSSISHMGFVLLGIFAWNELALQGAVMVMVAHGVATGALFILVGALQERTGTRDMARLGGIWATMPRLSGVTLLFALAAMGLPGMGNFVGEFLVLVGTFRANVVMAALAAIGIVLSAVYALWMIQRTFQGTGREGRALPDLSAREGATMAALVATILWLGLYPQPVLDAAGQALANLQRAVQAGIPAEIRAGETPALPAELEAPVVGASLEGPVAAGFTPARPPSLVETPASTGHPASEPVPPEIEERAAIKAAATGREP